MTETIGYAEAMAELEHILDDIDRGDVDVDQLSLRVRRAAELIKLCRGRIHATKLEVEEIVAELDATTPAGSDGTIGDGVVDAAPDEETR